MRTVIQTSGFELSDDEARLFQRHAAGLGRRLSRFDPDLVDLEVVLDQQARRDEFTSRARLVIMNRALPARRNHARSVTTLIGRVFDDLEEELAEFVAGLTGEAGWTRKRGMRHGPALRKAANRLQLERALLDQARAGDRHAFDRLAESRLTGLRRTIYEKLTAHSREPSVDELDEMLTMTLSQGFERLREKPESWSVHRWLSWIVNNPPAGRF